MRDKALVGSVGVHYVAFQLSSRGYAVALTAPGVKGVDLLTTDTETGKSLSIQVKTMSDARVNSRKWGTYWKWRIGKQIGEGGRHRGFYLTFVDLCAGPPDEPDGTWSPDVFIVPSIALEPLVSRFPTRGPPTDYWCVIGEEVADKYRNRWNRIDAALK
jgi:hypothetical protein